MDKYGDKEKVYDDKISPLMSQIIKICKEEKLNMVASFQLRSEYETDNEENFLCTTLLPMNEEHNPYQYRDFGKSIYSKPTVFAMTITSA